MLYRFKGGALVCAEFHGRGVHLHGGGRRSLAGSRTGSMTGKGRLVVREGERLVLILPLALLLLAIMLAFAVSVRVK